MRTTASFRLWGDRTRTAAAVTRRLGLTPTEEFEAGTPVSRRSARTRDSSLWLLTSSAEIEADVEVGDQLRRLLTILEPVTQPLWELVSEGYQANWLCYAASHATEHAVELDRRLLRRVLALPGDLWLDVGGDEETDE